MSHKQRRKEIGCFDILWRRNTFISAYCFILAYFYLLLPGACSKLPFHLRVPPLPLRVLTARIHQRGGNERWRGCRWLMFQPSGLLLARPVNNRQCRIGDVFFFMCQTKDDATLKFFFMRRLCMMWPVSLKIERWQKVIDFVDNVFPSGKIWLHQECDCTRSVILLSH